MIETAAWSDPDAPAARSGAVARFRALAGVARVATTTEGPDLLRRVSLAAMHALDGASVSLSVWEPDQERLRCVLNDGALGPGEILEPDDEYYALADYEPLVSLLADQEAFSASATGSGPYSDLVARLGKANAVVAPIPLAGRVWGELFVTRTADQPPFATDDLQFAVAVAAQVGAAIATSEHLGRAHVQAHTDTLTGLANRLAVEEWFESAMELNRAEATPVGLVVCDINGLKSVNDQNGHDAGDRVLRQMGQILTEQARQALPQALIARLGGDEFAVAVLGVEPDQLVAYAEEVASLAWLALPHGAAVGVASTGDAIGSIDNDKR
ncbi:MAG: GGDEF domain-containing protein, partial [Actinomycetes bacterium]